MRIKLRSTWDFDETHPLGDPGGFGAVFLGEGQDGSVAIKRLHISSSSVANREMKLAASLMSRNLSNVVPVLDYGLDKNSNRYFLVMPLCSGTLQKRNRSKK